MLLRFVSFALLDFVEESPVCLLPFMRYFTEVLHFLLRLFVPLARLCAFGLHHFVAWFSLLTRLCVLFLRFSSMLSSLRAWAAQSVLEPQPSVNSWLTTNQPRTLRKTRTFRDTQFKMIEMISILKKKNAPGFMCSMVNSFWGMKRPSLKLHLCHIYWDLM